MLTTDIAWFAGFYEGEGCVRLGSITNRGNGRIYGSPVLDICQVNIEPLKRCAQLFPNSHLYGPYKYSSNRQEHYKFTVLGREEVKKVYDLIKPLLSEKRRLQFEEAFDKHTELILNRPKLKRGPKTSRRAQPPSCHPDRKCSALGLCDPCYRLALKKRKHEEQF